MPKGDAFGQLGEAVGNDQNEAVTSFGSGDWPEDIDR